MVDVVSEFSKSLRIMTGCLVNFLSGVLPSICSESDDECVFSIEIGLEESTAHFTLTHLVGIRTVLGQEDD